jgi:hypothetical protein
MRFNSEITQDHAVGKQFRQKNEKPAHGKWGNGLVDYWIVGFIKRRIGAGIIPLIHQSNNPLPHSPHARSMYLPVRVSILIFSPVLMNSGT